MMFISFLFHILSIERQREREIYQSGSPDSEITDALFARFEEGEINNIDTWRKN